MLNGGAIMSCALILDLIQPISGLADKYDFLFNSLHKIGGDHLIKIMTNEPITIILMTPCSY